MKTTLKNLGKILTTVSEEEKSSLQLLDTLKAVGQCKLEKEGKDNILHPLLSKALQEIKSLKASDTLRNFALEVFLRNLFFVFSIQRQHNIWQEHRIKSDVLGSQMRKTGRSIVRWLATNMSDWLYTRDKDGFLYNLNLLVEYANYDLLFHNEIQTKNKAGKTGKFGSSKNPNRIVSFEQMNIPLELVVELAVQNYRRNKGRSLIARWLPKFTTSTKRYTKLVVGKDIKRSTFNCQGKESVKLNGKEVTGIVNIKSNDIIIYSRRMQEQTIERVKRDNTIVKMFCDILGWNMSDYNKFRHEYMKLTPEHQFSSGSVNRLTKDAFQDWLNKLSSGQQWVVSSHLCFKSPTGVLSVKPDTNWTDTQLPKWYLEWTNKQSNVTEDIRVAMSKGDTIKVQQLQKEVKVKTTGIQTIDLLTDIISGKKSEQEINTLHTALISKMDMVVPAYTILDGSGSMSSSMIVNGQRLSYLDIAITLAVTFMTTNPVQELKESCMWFGYESTFTGVTKYKNTAPNSFVTGDKFTKETEARKVINPSGTFTENFRRLHQANPNKVSSTNAGAVVTTFMSLIDRGQMSVESLPKVLLFITDEEYNAGVAPVQSNGRGFTQIPQTIGWNPLFVFWGLKTTSNLDKYKDAPNCLVTRGFSENNLSQILQFIKKGSISMYDELYAVHEMPGLSLIKV